MEKLLFPSLNCADFDCLKEEVTALDKAGADGFHLDISDGTIFPQLSMGLRDLQSVRRNTKKPVDVHLYMSNPSRFVEMFAAEGADIIYVFPEAEPFIALSLYKIRELRKSPGISVGWGTAVETLTDVLPLVDYVMVNASNPVKKESVLIENIYEKVEHLLELKEKYHFKLLMDGAITPEVISKASAMGVDGYAMGTGCLFGWAQDYDSIFQYLRRL